MGMLSKDALLTAPSDILGAKVPARSAEAYEDLGGRFRPKGARVYDAQYANLYFMRLAQLRDKAFAAAVAKWPDLPKQRAELTDVPESVEVIVVGTLVKDMKLKPCVMDEIQNIERKVLDRYVSDEDWLALEDTTTRVKLTGMDVAKLVNGLIIAVRGKTVKDCIHVSDFVFPAAPPAVPLPLREAPRYVCFVSGLEIAGQTPSDVLSFQHFLLGQSGGEEDRELAASVTRVICAGSCVASTDGSLAAIRDVDLFFASVARAIEVDLMPSLKDPSDALLPQNPLHPAFFPEARTLQAFRGVTNPYHCKVGDCEILGSSGEGVEDMQAFAELSPLEALVTSVKGRVLAPTAPDTLRCAPSLDSDPCVIGPSSPHVVFAGNTPTAEWAVIDSGTLCLCVPAFTKTPACVLVNIADVRDVQVVEWEKAMEL